MKRIFVLLLAVILVFSFTACDPSGGTSDSTSTPTTGDTSSDTSTGKITVAALESAYGPDLWKEVAAAFKEVSKIEVEVIMGKEIETVIRPQFLAGSGPDLVHVGLGRPEALTETMVKDKALVDITDVFEKTIPGESVTPASKMIDGFLETATIKPYGDDKIHLAPMFYSPTGLFYNKKLFEKKDWKVPETWEEMWALGETAKADKKALFAYPTSGYFDAFSYALISEAGGLDFFNDAMSYKADIWDTPEGEKVFDVVAKLASYTDKSVPSNAQNQNYLKNQQLIVDDEALFMPNGTWVTGEMEDAVAQRKEGDFEWGLSALPAFEKGGDRYSTTFFEQCWIPTNSKNIDSAKEFMAFLYSDKAAEIFATHDAVQPIEGISGKLTGEMKTFYEIYDGGAKAAIGGFSSAVSVEGVSMADSFFAAVDSLVSGDKTKEEWVKGIKEANKALNAEANKVS